MTDKSETALKKWEEMKEGDLILFCQDGDRNDPLTNYYSYSAVVNGKEKNKKIAKDLWGEDGGVTWELIFWMLPETLSKENVEMSVFNPLFGYSVKAGHVFPGPMHNSPIMKISLKSLLGALVS